MSASCMNTSWTTITGNKPFYCPDIILTCIRRLFTEIFLMLSRCIDVRVYDSSVIGNIQQKTRMWANAQHDGRPAAYRWRTVLNAATFGSRPLLECRAVTLPIGERKTWRTQSEFCTWQNSVTEQQPPKLYI